mmetsp:Transcript_2446/g.3288  ORF Transcript_2446/g.3288 Transcript_2446/m.3288 type:complete len:298 (+) Transcript_2446:355-1248(+)
MSGEESNDAVDAPSKRPRTTEIQCREKDSWVLLSQGAEARVWKVPKSQVTFVNGLSKDEKNKFMVVKERFSKAYRHPTLDERLTKQRCRMEGRLLEKCRQNPTLMNHVPKVLRVESPLLYLEYIEGMMLKQFFNETVLSKPNKEAYLNRTAGEMGRLIGTLHIGGIIHGDLTTSNIMINEQQNAPDEDKKDSEASLFSLYLIDFGLSKPLNQQKQGKNNNNINTSNIEEKAVDLYVLERAIRSIHPHLPPSFWPAIEHAYVTVEQPDTAVHDALTSSPVLKRLEQVRQRGRKRECFG